MPHLWVSADYTYYNGGETTVYGVPQNDQQDNSRGGLTLSVPVGQTQLVQNDLCPGGHGPDRLEDRHDRRGLAGGVVLTRRSGIEEDARNAVSVRSSIPIHRPWGNRFT